MKKLFAFFILMNICLLSQAQAVHIAVHKKAAKKWFKKKAWLHGTAIQPDKSIDFKEFYRQYHLNQADWDKTFAFLSRTDLAELKPGKYPINGDRVFASITESSLKPFDSTHWEGHKKYIDVQYVISGTELIGISPVAKAKVITPYQEKWDAANYSAEGKILTATPEKFFIFFPSDAHRPGISSSGNKTIRKLVIKVMYSE